MKNIFPFLALCLVCIQAYAQIGIPYNNDLLIVYTDDAFLKWGGTGTPIDTLNGAESQANGRMNTMAIVKKLGNNGKAAYYCDTLSEYGYSDWYLPSRHELDTMYAYKDTLGGINQNFYLSSTQYNDSTVWGTNFSNGNTRNNCYKDTSYFVRCVRRENSLPALTIMLDTIKDISCKECTDGEIHVDVNGGYPPYEYEWSNGSTDSILTGIDSAGIYTLTLTDAIDRVLNDTFYVRHFDTIIDPRDGQVYKIVKIGSQWWMAENLNATKYSDGTVIQHVTGNSSWKYLSGDQKAYCYYDDDSAYATIYGALYTWGGAMNGAGSDTANPGSVQGVCPNGWHLPSDNEWKQLERHLGMSKADANKTGSRGTNQGSQLAGSAQFWTDGVLENDPIFDRTGFTAVPGGMRYSTGLSQTESNAGHWWTSSLDGSGYAINRNIGYSNSDIDRSSTSKKTGFSVRCVKDIYIDVPMAVEHDSVVTVSCYGEHDGEIHLSVSGGTPPYSYIWAGNYPDTNRMTNLPAGSYDLTITDAEDDTLVKSYNVSEPVSLGYAITATHVACHGDSTGSINVNLYFDPDGLIWSNGETTENLSGVPAGNYTLTVTDYSDCELIIKKAVLEPSALMINSDITNIGCNGAGEGSIALSINGGTPSYTYVWNNSSTTPDRTALLAGDYAVTVTDSNNCTKSKDFTISTAESIMAKAGEDKRVCPGQLVTLTASGGDSYAWNTGATTQTINVSPIITTDYIVEAGKNGCTDSDTVTVYTDSSYCFTIDVQTTNATCGQADGSATLDISGGNSPFEIQWSTGDTAMVSGALQAGTYNVQVKDVHDNSTFKTFTINNISAPTIHDSITDVSCFNAADGTIHLSVEGGTAPYQYAWSTGATTRDIQNLRAGYFEVEIKDQNGCLVFGEYQVDEPDPLIPEIITTNASCLADTGSISVAVTGGMSPYMYNWSNDSSGAILHGLGVGTYTVTITDGNNCNKTATTSISSSDGPVVTIDSIHNTSCNMNEGRVYVSVSGGASPYSYTWSNGSTEQNLYFAGEGLHVLTARDQNGCRGVAGARIDVEPVAPPQICIVTTDSVTNHNIIAWPYQENPGVLGYNIYKEVRAGKFQSIGTTSSAGNSEFEDSLSNPMIRSYKYKLSALDACGNESEKSYSHKTIHLSVGLGFQLNSVNLTWDNYEGFYYDAYEVYRYSASLGWQLIETMPGSPEDVFNSYTDMDVPEDILHYIIAVDKGSVCRVTGEKAAGGPYSRSISNLEDNRLKLEDIPGHETNPLDLTVGPNPTRGKINISWTLPRQGEVAIELYDMYGRKISGIINKHCSSGKHTTRYTLPYPNIYFIKCKTNGQVVIKKVICE